jgi:hypothetical protein
MSIRERLTGRPAGDDIAAADAEPEALNLPEGYDDPDSYFYVPPQYRHAYAEAALPSLSILVAAASEIADQEARAAVWAERYTTKRGTAKPMPADDGFRLAEYAEKRQELLAHGEDRYLAKARHTFLKADAVRVVAIAEEEKNNAHRARVRFTCPVCERMQRTTRARVPLIDTRAVRSCEECSIEILRLANEAHRARLSPEALTRAAHAAATLAGA